MALSLIWIAVLFSSCDVLKLGTNIDHFKASTEEIGQNLSSGLIAGIDSSRLDSIVARLTDAAGQSLRRQLDSVSIHRIQDSLRVAVLGLVGETLDSLHVFLADSSHYDQLHQKLNSMAADLDRRLTGLIRNLVPNALHEEGLQQIYSLRDSLLGQTTALQLERLLTGSVEGLLKSRQLDSLIQRITLVIDNTTEKVDKTSSGLRRTVTTVGLVLAGVLFVLALLFFVLWFRKRTLAGQQKELLVNLTKAIDAIPTQDDYDKTVAFLQRQMAAGNDTAQEQILQEILQEHQKQYPQKTKYKAFYERLVAHIQASDPQGNMRRRLLEQAAEDPEFQHFLEQEFQLPY